MTFLRILFHLLTGIAFLFILYLLAIMPKIFHRVDMTPFKKYFAHRGLHQDQSIAPENSMAAFQGAVDKGYGIELDVQLSKDGVPVVFHDSSLKRVCGVDKRVCDLTFEQLKEFPLYTSKERIPALEDVLNMVRGRVPLIIELKMDNRDTRVCEVVAPMLDQYKGLYCIESFNPIGIHWFKKHRPQVIRGQLSTDFFKDGDSGDRKLFFLLKNLLFNFYTKPDFIAYAYWHRNSLSFALCRKLYRPIAIAWTVDSRKALEECKEDFHMFIFENFIPEVSEV